MKKDPEEITNIKTVVIARATADLCDEILDDLQVPDPPDKSMASLVDEADESRGGTTSEE
tara:strand:+ start:695 stop:874 length:180 start_codon:yes stop_codon:yes gene_type:complete